MVIKVKLTERSEISFVYIYIYMNWYKIITRGVGRKKNMEMKVL